MAGVIYISGLLTFISFFIIYKLNKMPTKPEFDALKEEINSALTNIAADITRLVEQLETGGMTAEEEAQVFADLRAIADRANTIAGVVPE